MTLWDPTARDSARLAGLPAVQGSAPALAPPVFAAAGERYYKVAAEALRVCEQLVRVIRPDSAAPVQPALQVSSTRELTCSASQTIRGY